MRNFTRLSPLSLLFFLLLLPANARADQLTVTSGSAFTTLAGSSFNLSGQGFTIRGGTEEGTFDSGVSCHDCRAGNFVAFGFTFPGINFSGSASINGVDYPQLYYQGRFTIGGGFVMPDSATSFTVNAPFTFGGGMIAFLHNPQFENPGSPVFSYALTGQGIATLQFNRFVDQDGVHFFSSNSITYQFQDPTVPEPATLLLLGTGLTGIAARCRRRKKADL